MLDVVVIVLTFLVIVGPFVVRPATAKQIQEPALEPATDTEFAAEIIYFTLGEERVGQQFRLAIVPGTELSTHTIEVQSKDRLGAVSWRPSSGSGQPLVIEVLTRALLKSQMTPEMRLARPDRLHPDGVEYTSDGCTIELGRLR